MALETQQHSTGGGVGQRSISLVIPCQAEYIGLCRLMAGVVGAREALGAEDIADLKLVVTEACTCFLGAEGSADHSAGALRVDYDVESAAWAVTVSDPARRHHIPSESLCKPASAAGLGLTIMRALVDTVEHTDSEAEGSVIRLAKRLLPQSADTR